MKASLVSSCLRPRPLRGLPLPLLGIAMLGLLTTGCRTAPDPVEEPASSPASTPRGGASQRDASAEDTQRREAIAAAVAHPGRPDEDRARDDARRPDEVLEFFQIAPGARVLELLAGGGYYAELLARVVGPEGTVYGHNTPRVLERFAEEPWSARLERLQLPQLERVDADLDALPLKDGELDAALMVLFYHDTYWLEVDRPALNEAIFRALKPGGVYGIIDHHAEAGSGTRDVESLHRVERNTVVAELLGAGFVLDDESDLLADPKDPRTANVFDEAIRGKTDRFVLRFRKPVR